MSTKFGVSVARLMAANPSIPLANVSAGQTFAVPCQPETECCPFFLYAVPEGTGFGEASAKFNVPLATLLAGNPAVPTVPFTRCGSEIKIPCQAGSPICTGETGGNSNVWLADSLALSPTVEQSGNASNSGYSSG